MEYIKFSLFFVLAHTVSYTIAGVIALSISKDIYESKSRHCDFLRDMSDEDESKYVGVYFIPAQILRGTLMSIILYPLLNSIADFTFLVSAIFFASLMLIYTHIAAVSPFIDNIEGYVYFKKEYLMRKYFMKFQLEMILYCVFFGLLISFLMGFVF